MSTATGSEARRARLERVISARADQALEWLQALVAVGSQAPDEAAAQALVVEIATAIGLQADLVPCDDGLESDPRFIPTGLSYADRPNCVVQMPGTTGSPLICNAHIDTVGVGDGWLRDPRGELEGTRLYGLGACDTKASTVSALLASAALLDLQEPPASPLVIHSVVDEEPGGNGTLALLRAADARQDPWLVVVMEPTSLRLCLGHRGMLSFEVECRGRQAHGSTSEGINAIEIASEVVLALAGTNRVLAARRAGPYGAPRINVGRIAGGVDVYTTPGACWLELSARYAPDERDLLDSMVRTAVAEASDRAIVSACTDYDAAETPGHDPAVQVMLTVLNGLGLEAQVSRLAGTCDLRHYRHRLRAPTVIFGPGDLAVAHSVDEHVELAEITTAARVLAELALHGPPTGGRR